MDVLFQRIPKSLTQNSTIRSYKNYDQAYWEHWTTKIRRWLLNTKEGLINLELTIKPIKQVSEPAFFFFNIKVHQILVDFKQSYTQDSIGRNVL